jgi:ATP-binding cassette subfamily B protein
MGGVNIKAIPTDTLMDIVSFVFRRPSSFPTVFITISLPENHPQQKKKCAPPRRLRSAGNLSNSFPRGLTPLLFENVSFRYGKNPVLENVSLSLSPGSLTALVGPSGSGKSTLLKLMARFYDPQEGRVQFGGVDATEIDPEKLLTTISMVFQDVCLFQDTIGNNIRYGRQDASQAEIEGAAKAACCHDFITALPSGYDTPVGEGGSTLSGGEKQRVSIARAILKNAPVILLDEATASLDPENEAEVQRAIGALIKARTVVMIAHRLKTVVHADRIIVLDKGKIVEEGKHNDLLAGDGLYAKLWRLQQSSEGWRI